MPLSNIIQFIRKIVLQIDPLVCYLYVTCMLPVLQNKSNLSLIQVSLWFSQVVKARNIFYH